MTSLVFRGPTTPTQAPPQATKGTPLTIDEVNQNFFALSADTATRLSMPNGGTVSGNVIVSGTGNITLNTSGDITAYRSGGTTGVINLNNNGTRYLYNDGSLYQLVSQGLTVGGNVNAPGLSGVWGTTSTTLTGAINAVMGTSTNATWLLSGTSGGVFKFGLQGLDAGDSVRLYSGANYMQYIGSTGALTFSGASIVTATAIHGTNVYADAGYFRNSTSGVGLYNAANANNFYSNSAADWAVAAASGATIAGLLFRTSANATKGSVKWDATGFGLLNDADVYSLKINYNASGLGGSLLGAWTISNGLAVTGTLTATTSISAPTGTITTLNATNSNVGTVVSGVWNGSAVPIQNGGTGGSSSLSALTNLLPLGTTGQVLKTGGAGSYYWANEGGATAPVGTRIDTTRSYQTATLGQTLFTGLPTYVIGANQLRVYVNGVRQFSSEYTETGINQVTMGAGLLANDLMLFEIDGYIIYVQTALATVFTPVGAITAINVQDAIADLETRKALVGQTMYVGTTQIAINRSSAALVLTGITSIDGLAAQATNLVGGNLTTLLGSMPYQSDTNVTTMLAPNTSATKNFLTQTGTGTNGAAPVWGTIAFGDVSGVAALAGNASQTFACAAGTGAQAVNKTQADAAYLGITANAVSATSATTAAACSGNSATATTAAACSGNSATATNATQLGGIAAANYAPLASPAFTTQISVGSTVIKPSAATHGALSVDGVKGGYNGINFRTGTTNIGTFMVENNALSTSLHGWFNAAQNGWSISWNNAGDFTASGNITAYSDERLKTNIQTLTGSLARVCSMRGVEYDRDGIHNIGVIAQEMQKIRPEVVHTGQDEMQTLSVAYGNIVAELIEAIKELKLEIDVLKGVK